MWVGAVGFGQFGEIARRLLMARAQKGEAPNGQRGKRDVALLC